MAVIALALPHCMVRLNSFLEPVAICGLAGSLTARSAAVRRGCCLMRTRGHQQLPGAHRSPTAFGPVPRTIAGRSGLGRVGWELRRLVWRG